MGGAKQQRVCCPTLTCCNVPTMQFSLGLSSDESVPFGRPKKVADLIGVWLHNASQFRLMVHPSAISQPMDYVVEEGAGEKIV